MKNKNYGVEFKVKAVELAKSSGRARNDVAKELGIAASSLCKWERQYEAGEFSEKTPVGSAEKEIARLTAELKRKTMEVEILKKATAFFAKENS